MTDTLAARQPVRFSTDLPDGRLAGLAWPNPDKPRLVFIHANGFCASTYKALLGRLADDYDILAPDLRGHGRSKLAADPARHRNWTVYTDDVTRWLASLDRPADAFAGHSMGAVIALLCADRQARAAPLALIEPVILPLIVYLTARSPFHRVMHGRIAIAVAARKRFDGWTEPGDAAKRYARHPTFRNWADGVLDDYLEDGLEQADDGQYRLACAPAWEAANYEAQGNDVAGALSRRVGPVRVLGAEHGSTIINRRMLTKRGIQIEPLEGAGHLAPMEAPKIVADWLATSIARDLTD